MIRRLTVPLVTAADGSGTVYSSAIMGTLIALRYNPGSLDTGADITITNGDDNKPILTKSNSGTTAAWFYPRDLVHGVADGAALTGKGAHIWVADRAANAIVVVDTATDQVVNEIALAGPLSEDPAPDLIDASPDGAWVFASLRGLTPLTGNAPDHHNAVGTTPGVGIVRVDDSGRSGELIAVLPIANPVDGVETADPHGMRVRPT